MRNFLVASFTKIATYATIIVIFTHNVLFEREVACTCEGQKTHCDLYIGLPVVIIMLLLLWTDKVFKRTSRYNCTCSCFESCCQSKDPGSNKPTESQSKKKDPGSNKPTESQSKKKDPGSNKPTESQSKKKDPGSNKPTESQSWCNKIKRKCFCTPFLQIIKAALIGALWVVSVLIDGDWYACCHNGLSGPEAQIPCKEKSNRTPEEQALVDNLKNHSKDIGFSVLLVILFLAVCWSSVEWRKCCEKTCCCNEKHTCCDRAVLYELVILEQQEKVLKDIWMEKAKEDLTKKISKTLGWKKQEKKETENSGHEDGNKNQNDRSKYRACCDAAEELIKELTEETQRDQVTGEKKELSEGEQRPEAEDDDAGPSQVGDFPLSQLPAQGGGASAGTSQHEPGEEKPLLPGKDEKNT